MKARVTYRVNIITEEIDLTDYGYSEDQTFEDLEDSEKIEIEDALRVNTYVKVGIETI